MNMDVFDNHFLLALASFRPPVNVAICQSRLDEIDYDQELFEEVLRRKRVLSKIDRALMYPPFSLRAF
jgi:hypothetical protein